jgi:dTDP-4-dehydrorhamnose 3,5-epimerase
MKIIDVSTLKIPEIKVIKFARFSDNRGYFTEHFRRSDLETHPQLAFFKNKPFVQGNESYSNKNVIRGLHFQWNPLMGKLVRTINGHMIDMVLDIRKDSPTHGNIIAFDMPSRPADQEDVWIWVPPGFAHGNYFLEDTTIEYLCTGEYSQGCEAGISPFSSDIDWSLCDVVLKTQLDQIVSSAIISDKDKQGLSLNDWMADDRSNNFLYRELS